MKKSTASTTAAVAATATRDRQSSALTAALNQVLADTYSLMALTHLAHWNVEGRSFFQLHEAFGTQYTALFEAADEIAERIRALGDYAAGGLQTLGAMSGLKEFRAPLSETDTVAALIAAHEKVINDTAHARTLSEQAGDLETQDLMIGRIQWHQKTVWMLRSFLKG
ncbi:MAG: DNA starvation/stationary phase protection protein [Verrucomicrobiales bacterium]|nr:DNA starvation/stationary phase protection protein [Verrucomicrobiales bacterium]